MTDDIRLMTDHELADHMANDALTAKFKNEWRRRYPKKSGGGGNGGDGGGDPGHFFGGNHGKFKGIWTYVKDGKYSFGYEQGEKWEEFKRTMQYFNDHTKFRDKP